MGQRTFDSLGRVEKKSIRCITHDTAYFGSVSDGMIQRGQLLSGMCTYHTSDGIATCQYARPLSRHDTPSRNSTPVPAMVPDSEPRDGSRGDNSTRRIPKTIPHQYRTALQTYEAEAVPGHASCRGGSPRSTVLAALPVRQDG
jgi:hypothetical protein